MREKQTTPRQPMTALEKAAAARAALVAKRAVNPVVLDLREITFITDYFVICHGTSNVHIRALSEAVLDALKEAGVRPAGVEGREGARWVLLDYGDVIVHIFAEEEREFYSLERLWSDAPEVAEGTAAATT
ncbi:MAG: ribosome silencing factor [Armatimonadota bacterium]